MRSRTRRLKSALRVIVCSSTPWPPWLPACRCGPACARSTMSPSERSGPPFASAEAAGLGPDRLEVRRWTVAVKRSLTGDGDALLGRPGGDVAALERRREQLWELVGRAGEDR